MEIDNKKEIIKRNVKIIMWVLIVIKSVALYLILFGKWASQITSHSNGSTIPAWVNLLNFNSIPLYILIGEYLSFVMCALVIYNALGVLKFREKSRKLLRMVIIADVIISIGLSLYSFGSTYYQGITWNLFTLKFIIEAGINMTFILAINLLYIYFVRFLNKPQIKAVFIAP